MKIRKCRHIDILKQSGEGKKISHLHRTKDRFIIQVNFSMPDDMFWTETMWIDDFVGDTPRELADSLQGWVDKLRSYK